MGIFGLFKGSEKEAEKEQKAIPWHRLTTLEQLKTIKEESKGKPVAIFKHSTRCGISRMVMNQFEKSYDLTDNQMKLYYLDLLSFRDVSDEVGYAFQVMHQSPQLIIIKNGTAVAHASHHSIQASSLHQYI